MSTFTVSPSITLDTERALASPTGERTALWQLSEPPDADWTVTALVVPEQTPRSSTFGHLVHVAGDELARIQFDAYHAGRRTWIQLHTHPGRNVTMSRLDRQWAIADFPGALSIIVPSFGRGGLTNLRGVAVYERSEREWRRWSAPERDRRLKVR